MGSQHVDPGSVLPSMHGPDSVARIPPISDATEFAGVDDPYREAFEHAGSGIMIVDLECRPIMANRPAERLLGRSSRELRTITCGDLIDPGEVDEDSRLFDALLRGDSDTCTVDRRLIRADGSVLRARITRSVVRSADRSPRHVVVTIEDVGEIEDTQSALDVTEQRYRTLTEQIPAVTYVSPPDDRMQALEYVSPQIEELLGYPAERWRTDPDLWYRCLHPDDRARAIAESEGADASGDPYVSEYRLIRRDGKVVWVEDRGILVKDHDGVSLFWHGVLLDATQRKESEQQLLRMIEVLHTSQRQRTKLAERLVGAEEVARHHIAQDLHDDPIQQLTAAQIRLATTAHSMPEERQEPFVKVEDLLTGIIARLRSMMFDLHPKVLESDGLAAAVRETCTRLAEDRTLEWSVIDKLHTDLSPELSAVAFRVIKEALTNVQKHAQASSVEVALASHDIDEAAIGDGTGGMLHISITDDGVGFDPASMSTGREGHAGLDAMRERLELFGGGGLEIRSSPGSGATISCHLPLTLAA